MSNFDMSDLLYFLIFFIFCKNSQIGTNIFNNNIILSKKINEIISLNLITMNLLNDIRRCFNNHLIPYLLTTYILDTSAI